MKKIILIFSLIIAMAASANAASTGAQFLKIDTDARVSGMASAGAASVYGISAINYNPAGLSAINTPEVEFSHNKWLMDSNLDFAGFGAKAGTFKGEQIALGIGVTRLSNGAFDSRAEDRTASGTYSAWDQVVSVGVGVKNFGFAVKYIQSSIAGVTANAFAIDLGAKHQLSSLPLTLGLGVQNLGNGIKYLTQRDNLPLSVNAGASLMALPGIALTVDARRLVYDRQTAFSAGTEYAVLTGNGLGFALRGGYGLTGTTATNNKNGLSVGAGIVALGAQLDYAMSPQTDLGSVQRITLKKKF